MKRLVMTPEQTSDFYTEHYGILKNYYQQIVCYCYHYQFMASAVNMIVNVGGQIFDPAGAALW